MKKYNYKEIYDATLNYFNGDDLATTTWINKYCLRDREGSLYELTPDDMHIRIASELFRIENTYLNPTPLDEIYNLLKDFKYLIPQGSPMFGIGNPFLITSLSNCFVIDSPFDSYPGIMKTEQQMISIYKRRGGVGLSLETLRPQNIPTSSVSNKSSGVVLFAERYSNTTREVAQDGRRGALMLALDVHHPDVESYIEAKVDLKKITGANVSLKVTDEFMSAVKENCQYTTKFKSNKGDIEVKLDAKKIWDKIIYNAWNCIPYNTDILIKQDGIIRKKKIGDVVENKIKADILSLNLKTHKLEYKPITNHQKIFNNENLLKIKTRSSKELSLTKDHKLYKLSEFGDIIEVESKNIKIGDYIAISKKTVKESLLVNRKFSNSFLQFAGLWLAEGSLYKNRNKSNVGIRLSIHQDEVIDYRELFNEVGREFNAKWNQYNDPNSKYCEINWSKPSLYEALVVFKENNRKIIPSFIYELSIKQIGYFLRGLFDGDGTIYNNIIAFSQSNKDLIEDVRQLLLMLGIHTKIGINTEEGKRIIMGRECNIKNCYYISIYRQFNNLFKQYVGFSINRKNRLLNLSLNNLKEFLGIPSFLKIVGMGYFGKAYKNYISSRNISNRINNIDERLRKISDSDIYWDMVVDIDQHKEKEEYVYDITVQDNHTFVLANGLIISNCAEPGVLFWDTILRESPADCYEGFKTTSTNPCGEIPLCPLDSCRLLVINLYSYIENPFTIEAYFNIEKFKSHVRIAQRIMDNIVDLEIEKIDKIILKVENDGDPDDLKVVELELWRGIKEKAIQGRRTGLGITAEGDMLAALGLRYGTKEATEYSRKIHKILAVESYKSSIEMARERGCFPIWNGEKEMNNPFLGRVLEEFRNTEYQYIYERYGRRNIGNLTIAPTGTTSIMTQTTSGIEPLFLPRYKRRRKTNDKTLTVFTDENGDMWEEFIVVHPKLIEWFKINYPQVPQDLLYHISEEEFNKYFEQSPYYKATSNDIDWREKVRMQGEIQKWVDHSISVTINLPKETTVELVDELYMLAYDSGCKGVTIYREGSRSGVLIKDEEEFLESKPPKRPRVLKADYYIITANGIKYAVIVGLWKNTNKPYEVFAFENPPILKNTTGKIVKVSKGYYKFINHEFEIEDLQLAANRIEERTLTLAASMLLRHGAPIKHVNHVIKKIDENITSFSSAVRRCLSKYDKDEITDKKCPVCGDVIVMQDGCEKCKSCDYGKCG